MNPTVNYLRIWHGLCELPVRDGPRTHHATLDEIAAAIHKAKGTVRKLFGVEVPTTKKQRFYAGEILKREVPQPDGARAFLAGVAAGAPDHELQRLEAAARAGPAPVEWPLSESPTRGAALPDPEPRPMGEKLLKALAGAGVHVPMGLRRGDRVLLYARQDIRMDGQIVIDQGDVITMGRSRWASLATQMPGLWRHLELITEPTPDYIREARHLSFARLDMLSAPARNSGAASQA